MRRRNCIVLSVAAVCAAGFVGARAESAREILDATGVQGGLIVHVGCGAGTLTAALHAGDGHLVHGLDADAGTVAKARAYIQSRGLYGPVSVDRFDGRRLPYADNLVRLVVAKDLGEVSMDEVLRVLAPSGVAYIGGKKTVKPRPTNIDEWTHYLHDATGNAVARDTVVGPPERMQWVADPLYARSHEIDSSMSALVSTGERIFYIYDEGLIGITDERLPSQWSLIARDAFSGVLLWKKPMPRWGWREWKKSSLAGKNWTEISGQRTRFPSSLARRLVAEGDRVYVTLAYAAPLTILDAATGKVLRTCKGTEGTDEILCSDGIVVVCVRDIQDSQNKERGKVKSIPDRLMGLNATSGDVLWTKQGDRVQGVTMAAVGGRLVFASGKHLICLDLKTGGERWRTPRKGGGTLVARTDVVLMRGGNTFEAFAMKDGRPLWKKSLGGAGGAVRADLLVAGGLVWQAATTPGLITNPSRYWDQPFQKPRSPQTGVTVVGVDPLTGEKRKEVAVKNLVTPGHHFRCYRSKATERYILWPKRAMEFIDLEGDNHMRNDWVRGICRYGVMPCNGLVYVPPNQCFCYTGVDVAGFKSLAAAAPVAKPDSAPRFEKGAAYGERGTRNAERGSEDWETFRGDVRRSASAATQVPTKVKQVWSLELGGKLTQPVIADGRLYVASVDTHTVHALDARSGRKVWSFTTGGRVDSPPTIHEGLALFGSADGWVYCVRAADGALAWRFRAAPQRRRIVAFGQVESTWPVHGSVLVKDGVAYASAGRSSYLDGGIRVYGLDPRTGKLLHETCIDGPHPDLGKKDIGEPFSADGTFSDVLVSDGTYLYMQQVMLDARLKQQTPPRVTNMGDKKFGRHVFSTAGFLNDNWWNRTFWMHSERYPGFYIAQQSPKTGQLVVHDEKMTYGVKCYTKRNVHSPMFFPGKEGYLLVADDNDNEPILVGDAGAPKAIKWLPHQHGRKELQLTYKAVDFDKGVGFARSKLPAWSTWIPVRARAMVIAGETLVIAGPPDVLDPKDPLAAFEGRAGGVLWTISATDGTKIAEWKLDSPPVFDGMAAAAGKLYLSLTDGSILCFGEK